MMTSIVFIADDSCYYQSKRARRDYWKFLKKVEASIVATSCTTFRLIDDELASTVAALYAFSLGYYIFGSIEKTYKPQITTASCTLYYVQKQIGGTVLAQADLVGVLLYSPVVTFCRHVSGWYRVQFPTSYLGPSRPGWSVSCTYPHRIWLYCIKQR